MRLRKERSGSHWTGRMAKRSKHLLGNYWYEHFFFALNLITHFPFFVVVFVSFEYSEFEDARQISRLVLSDHHPGPLRAIVLTYSGSEDMYIEKATVRDENNTWVQYEHHKNSSKRIQVFASVSAWNVCRRNFFRGTTGKPYLNGFLMNEVPVDLVANFLSCGPVILTAHARRNARDSSKP